MKFSYTLLAGIVISLSLSACATSGLKEGGEKVRVLDPQEVTSCRKLGETNTQVTANLAGIPRPIETITKELKVVARNAAARMGGDTVVPLTVISDGAQTFEVFKCIDPEG